MNTAQIQHQDRGAAMPVAAPHRLLRLRDVVALSGLSKSTVYLRIQQGLFPKPIALGGTSVAWPEREVAAINEARIRGASDEEIKELVSTMATGRKGEN
jgi:prophage regulatory protein